MPLTKILASQSCATSSNSARLIGWLRPAEAAALAWRERWRSAASESAAWSRRRASCWRGVGWGEVEWGVCRSASKDESIRCLRRAKTHTIAGFELGHKSLCLPRGARLGCVLRRGITGPGGGVCHGGVHGRLSCDGPGLPGSKSSLGIVTAVEGQCCSWSRGQRRQGVRLVEQAGFALSTLFRARASHLSAARGCFFQYVDHGSYNTCP